jgi:hypothetical protein
MPQCQLEMLLDIDDAPPLPGMGHFVFCFSEYLEKIEKHFFLSKDVFS